MPKQAGGTYNITNAEQTVGGSQLYVLLTFANGTQYISRSGTVTKTATNKFTLSATMVSLLTNNTISISAGGNY